MAKSTLRKGNYYRNRTRDWLVSIGFEVVVAEVTKRIVRKDRKTGELLTFYQKYDLWGADLIARNAEELIFVQCKANLGDIAAGMKQLSVGDWPPFVKRWVVYWPPRRRLEVGPEIEEVKTDVEEEATP